jgi:hypothetical protein
MDNTTLEEENWERYQAEIAYNRIFNNTRFQGELINPNLDTRTLYERNCNKLREYADANNINPNIPTTDINSKRTALEEIMGYHTLKIQGGSKPIKVVAPLHISQAFSRCYNNATN